MKKSVKRKTACMAAVFLVILAVITGMCLWKIENRNLKNSYREQIVVLNEIEKMTEIQGESPAKELIAELQEELRQMNGVGDEKEESRLMLMIAGSCGIFVVVVFFYIYCVILRPFEELEAYAAQIAKGDLEVELPYHRARLFGAFTWAFDHMRREIIKARACEKEAIENNKTVTATLSHDIKTPIASIRAYAEGLEANMDTSPERKSRYLSVIMKKCDEVTKLTNDLFLHSLSDLEKLQINSEPIALGDFLTEVLEGLKQQQTDIRVIGEVPCLIVQADRKRLEQAVENVIANARKYASETEITLWIEKCVEDKESVGECCIHIKDNGRGILPENMPFVLEKFYRGKNAGNEDGAGLGLYIVDYVMKQMGGSVELKNCDNGLEVVLSLKIC